MKFNRWEIAFFVFMGTLVLLLMILLFYVVISAITGHPIGDEVTITYTYSTGKGQ